MAAAYDRLLVGSVSVTDQCGTVRAPYAGVALPALAKRASFGPCVAAPEDAAAGPAGLTRTARANAALETITPGIFPFMLLPKMRSLPGRGSRSRLERTPVCRSRRSGHRT